MKIFVQNQKHFAPTVPWENFTQNYKCQLYGGTRRNDRITTFTEIHTKMRHLGTTDVVATNSRLMAKNSQGEKKDENKEEYTPSSQWATPENSLKDEMVRMA